MEIIARLQGLTGRRFAMDEVQPVNGVPYNSFTAAIQARYNFQTLGVSVEAQQKGSTAPAFEVGEFLWHGIPHNIAGLEFLPDGLRAIGYTTEVTDAFIADLLKFAQDSYGYQTQNIKRPAIYSSAILVRLNVDDLSYFSFLQRSSTLLEEELSAAGKSLKARPFGIRLIASEGDQKTGAMYVLEKRAGPEAGGRCLFQSSSTAHGLPRAFS